MSLADKLTLIAENEQRVYNAGYEKGKAEGGDNDWLNFRTNGGTNFGYLYCAMNHIEVSPILDTSKGMQFANMYNGCTALITVPLINISNAVNIASMFKNATKLQNITFEGTIPKSIDFSNSPNLTSFSLENIITALKDLSGQTTQTLTLHDTSKSKLTEEQIEIIENKNWILA